MQRVEAAADRPLADRVAVVTGGSSGIGRAACVALARAGASIVAVGRPAARLEETIEQARGGGGGDIINVSSTSGLRGFAYDAAYCASKFGIIGLSEALAEEVRRSGIRVQAICPGPAATAMWDQNLPVPPPEQTMPVERVVDLLMYILSLPRDTVLHNPVIVPFRSHRRSEERRVGKGWRSRWQPEPEKKKR